MKNSSARSLLAGALARASFPEETHSLVAELPLVAEVREGVGGPRMDLPGAPVAPSRKWPLAGPCRLSVLISVALAAAAGMPAQAQTDNFNSYSSAAQLSAAGWILMSLNPALVSTTFPAVGAGKGLRLQANPVPNAAPAVGGWYRTNDYTDFYFALDIASWPGTSKDQAFVMFGRLTDATTGTVVSDQNPADAQGMICNYDTSQYGESAGSRRQGQLQMNVVSAGFGTRTIAASDITFVPGRSYRLVFQGVGTHYTAQAYDWNDLTLPLVTLEADDSTYSEGACGILGLSRNGTTGTMDLTYDNYFVAASNPKLAPAPALAHPIPGTPAVVTRIPAQRWQNFVNPATSLSFTANTWSTNVINASATTFRLNGADVSGQLTLSVNGTNLSGSLPAGLLQSNMLYSAEIVVTDLSGVQKGTNTFWFDTFSDGYLLSSTVKTIEAEEYNYSGGGYQLDPIPVSGIDTNGNPVNGGGIGYYDLLGTAGIDYSNNNTSARFPYNAFRTQDAVRTLSGGLFGVEDEHHLATEPGSDTIRSQHGASNLLEYVVCQTQPNEWLDYSRSFAPGLYQAYLRFASFGATSNELYVVTSDPTQPEQTTTRLGTFRISNNIMQHNYLYTPLVDDSGVPVLVTLAGTNTLRLQMAGTVGDDVNKALLNYIMLVQAPVTLYSSASVSGPYAAVTSATINTTARTITVQTSGSARFYRLGSAAALSIKSISVSGGTVMLTY
jgi:hypothetical protein